jgi:hypothetical protein
VLEGDIGQGAAVFPRDERLFLGDPNHERIRVYSYDLVLRVGRARIEGPSPRSAGEVENARTLGEVWRASHHPVQEAIPMAETGGLFLC